jgi:hypothetical protein
MSPRWKAHSEYGVNSSIENCERRHSADSLIALGAIRHHDLSFAKIAHFLGNQAVAEAELRPPLLQCGTLRAQQIMINFADSLDRLLQFPIMAYESKRNHLPTISRHGMGGKFSKSPFSEGKSNRLLSNSTASNAMLNINRVKSRNHNH